MFIEYILQTVKKWVTLDGYNLKLVCFNVCRTLVKNNYSHFNQYFFLKIGFKISGVEAYTEKNLNNNNKKKPKLTSNLD